MLNRGFDFKYCSDPGAIEMIIVKSPSMPLLGAGGGYWGIPLTGALQRDHSQLCHLQSSRIPDP